MDSITLYQKGTYSEITSKSQKILNNSLNIKILGAKKTPDIRKEIGCYFQIL